MDALSGKKLFDASQYAFFGRDCTGEIEIGGLDEDVDTEELKLCGIKHQPECETQSISTSSTSWFDLANEDSDLDQQVQKLQTRQQSSSGLLIDGVLGSSSHQAPQLPWWAVDSFSFQNIPLGIPNPLYGSQQARTTPSAGPVQMLESPGQRMSGTLQGLHRHLYFSSQPYQGMSSFTPYSGGFSPHYSLSGSKITGQMPAEQWSAPSNIQLGSGPGSHITLMPPQVVIQYEQPLAPLQLNGPQSPPLPSHLKPHNLPPELGEYLVNEDFRGQVLHRGRETQGHHQQTMSDGNFFGRNTESSGWQLVRSKYMTLEEIENIVRIQWAATHSSDPYVDDYYHQALQAKLSARSGHGRRHFAPSHLQDLPSHTRASLEPHPYLQVEALGRVPFSSLRRPRPLLEVESSIGPNVTVSDRKIDSVIDAVPQHRPLEQEPLLGARIVIEDSLCLLLDVDDIDRMLSSSQLPDGGVELRWRRQLLLEALSASLQLLDSNGIQAGVSLTNRWFARPSVNDDLVFLQLVSLQKGRKFFTRFVELLTPGSELVYCVAMAMFRHLRFLFGGVLSDERNLATTVALANATAISVSGFELPALSACLAAVVLAPEQPPLRPLGMQLGDGATVVLRAVLERATNLLSDRNAACLSQNRAIWQTAFDAFFVLLITYCTNKYESIFHSLMMASAGNSALIDSVAAIAMSKEIPVELLRASLPHTNDHQRKLLLEFAQRSMAMDSFPHNIVNDTG